jgi:lipid-A-disaccharide synthase
MPPPEPIVMMVAGETSGDMHAAKVIQALRKKNPKIKIFGMGGPKMAQAGMDVREDLTQNAIMGFAEVVKHFPVILRRMKEAKRWLKEEHPDVLFLIDYPGFNLSLAQASQSLGIPVCYYVAPQVWAWHPGRIEIMKKVINKLLVILPFEKAYFAKNGMSAVYVGHPLMEEMDLREVKRAQVLEKNGLGPAHFPLICVMPGSRRGEIEKIWPLFLRTSRQLRKSCPDAAFVVPKPEGMDQEVYSGLKPEDPFFFMEGPAYDLRKVCDLAWVKSGTSTLETALLKTPMVVVYKVAGLTGILAKLLLKVKMVSLVNLLSEGKVVAELLQEKASPRELLRETNRLLEDAPYRNRQIRAFQKIKKSISAPPRASENAAKEILKVLRRSR